jgi:hypothetical protein
MECPENFDPENLNVPEIVPGTSSLSIAAHRLEWWTRLEWNMHLMLAFLRCNRSEWDAANIHLKILRKTTPGSDAAKSDSRKRWLTYLSGVIEQGSGNTDNALACFQDPLLALPAEAPTQTSDPQSDLQLLAALNTLLIIHSRTHPSYYLAEPILTALEPLTINHPNQAIVSAMHLLKSIINLSQTMTSQKQSLQSALNCARAIKNSQLLAVSMNVMTSMFFRDIVGSQAQQSTNTARVLAGRARSGLWGAVAAGMTADTLEALGNAEGANNARADAERAVEALPPAVKRTLLQEY